MVEARPEQQNENESDDYDSEDLDQVPADIHNNGQQQPVIFVEESDSFASKPENVGAVQITQMLNQPSQIGGGALTTQARIHQVIQEPDHQEVKEGELQKYSPALFAGWQRRRFRIEDGIMQYFKGN